MADTPAGPHDPDRGRGDSGSAPVPGRGTSESSPLESALAPAPGSALAGAAAVDDAQAARAISRSRFLSGATVGVGGLMSAAIAAPALTFVIAPVFKSRKYYDVDVGPVSNFPVDKNYRVVTFESEPNDTSGLGRRVAFVRHDGGDKFTILSNQCMHLGCPVRSFGTSFGCPCHGGQYDSEGRRIAGPPVRPLNRYNYRVENGHLILGSVYAVNNQLHRYHVKGPGQPVSGWMSYLYPPAPQ